MTILDLDELIQSCRDEEARKYVAEAVACYKAGAPRACIVATWIAIVFDIIAKIRELSLAGDAEAQIIIGNLTKWQPQIESGHMPSIRQSLELERDIVNVAHEKFGFLDGIQVRDLIRLRDDRNRCAHPTFQGSDQPYLPSSELARTHLVHAVRYVLSQPPVQGKAATEHILKAVKSQYFPTDLEAAKVQLRSAGLERPKESLVRSVADHLVFGFLEGASDIGGRKQTVTALHALYELHPGHSEPRIQRALNSVCRRISDKRLPLFLPLLRHIPQTWQLLEPDNKRKIIELVLQCQDGASAIIRLALQVSDLVEYATVRIASFDRKQLSDVLQKAPHEAAIARAVDIYCSSGNWDAANSNYNSIIKPIQDKLNVGQIKRILIAQQEEHADLPGSHGFAELVNYVYDNERLPKEEVLTILRDHGIGWLADNLAPRAVAEDEADKTDFPF